MDVNGAQGGQMINNGAVVTPSMQRGMMPSSNAPMSPEKKKKLILGISLGVGGVVMAIIGIVVATIMLRPDYGDSYRVAKELQPMISKLGSNYDCVDVIEDVSSTYTDVEDYEENIEGCLTVADGVPESVAQLGQTTGVKRDKDVKARFDRFQEAIDSILLDETELESRLKVYLAWHKFIVANSETSYTRTSDAEFQSVAKNLTESGNEILASYGAGWLERTLAAAKAYRTWSNASFSAKNYAELRQAAHDASAEQSTWVSENAPDIAEVGGLEFKNNRKMEDEFDQLYDLIVELYEENYDDSGECTEFLGEVFCD